MAEARELPPNPSRLIEGLRDTGYDFNTALADIVDNSVDAGATQIAIWISMDPEGDVEVSVADNGCGMDEPTLLDGMTYGATGRVDPKRLGKFGLGLKTASTAFCRKFSVVTRSGKGSKPRVATWDLDHIEKTGKWLLLLDAATAGQIEALDAVAKGKSGTLVVWQNVDRLLKAYSSPSGGRAQKALDKVVESFRQHAAMVYQRFLDKKDERTRNIGMQLNGSAILPWDPFCRDEARAEMVGDETKTITLDGGGKAPFTIRAFILPRKEEFSSEARAKQARLSNDMQGIYIYRENRLIHPSDWLGMFSKEPHLTLLRVEFSFDHRLDEAFQVDIKKSRILLDEELHDWVLKKFITAPRNAANERSRKGQLKKLGEIGNSAHAESNRAIGSREEELKLAEIKINNAATGEVEITNKKGRTKLTIKIDKPSRPGEVNVRAVAGIDDGLLWEPMLLGVHHAVSINSGHPYYGKVYVPNLASGVTIQGMDALLWALAEAELGTINSATRNHFKELRFEVSRLLRELVNDLPEPDLDGGGK